MDKLALSQEAQQSDQTTSVTSLPVDRIYADPEFNCRGAIAPKDVIDLAKSIARDGLQQPISVRPRREDDPMGYDWVIISGHRRHRAYQLLQHTAIPCIVREHLDDFKARTLNAIENLKREDLNLLQEAKTIKHFVDAGWNRAKIAEEVGMSPAWVQIRQQLLKMPEEIQYAAAAGQLTQNHVRDLYQFRNNPNKQLEVARKIKEHREKSLEREGKRVNVELTVKTNKPDTKKVRKRGEMFDIIEILMEVFEGSTLATRVLAWAGGEINDLELHQSIKKFAEKEGRVYVMPTFE